MDHVCGLGWIREKLWLEQGKNLGDRGEGEKERLSDNFRNHARKQKEDRLRHSHLVSDRH